MATSELDIPPGSSSSAQKIIPHLHHLDHSQAHRVHWLLQEIQLKNPAFQFKISHYPRMRGPVPGLVAVHPLGKSPVVSLETSDGSPPPTIQLQPGVLSESKLIQEWLSSEYGNGQFDPESEEDKRRDNFFSEFALSTLRMKIDFATVFDAIPQMLPFPISSVVRLLVSPMLSHWMSDLLPILTFMESELSDEKPWFSGEKIGLADFNMSFGMDTCVQRGWFEKLGGKEKFPKLWAWCERVWAREGYKKALEEAKKQGGGGYDLITYGMK